MEKTKRKNLILILLVIVSFAFGTVTAYLTDAYFGDRITIHYMSEIEAKEDSISKITDDAEFEERLLDLIDDCYGKASDFDLMAGAYYSELYHIDEKNLSYDEAAESNSLKGYLLDLKENRLKLYYDYIYGYSVAPDLAYFLKKYKTRLSEDAKAYLLFRKDDMENGLYDKNLNTFSIDKAVEKIDFINSYISTNGNDAPFSYAYTQLLDYYMGIYDGTGHNFFVDYETKKLTPYAKQKYKEYADRNDEIGQKARENLLTDRIDN